MPTIIDLLRDALGGGTEAEQTINQLSAGEQTLLHELIKRIDASKSELTNRIDGVERHLGALVATAKADVESQVRRSAKSLLTQLRKDLLPFVPGIFVQGDPCRTPHEVDTRSKAAMDAGENPIVVEVRIPAAAPLPFGPFRAEIELNDQTIAMLSQSLAMPWMAMPLTGAALYQSQLAIWQFSFTTWASMLNPAYSRGYHRLTLELTIDPKAGQQVLRSTFAK